MNEPDPILLEMAAAVAAIIKEFHEAPQDQGEFIDWANEVITISHVGKMRRTVYHAAITGPAMAYVLRSDGDNGRDVRKEPIWRMMMDASKVAGSLCSFYGTDGRELDFEGWVEEMATIREATVISKGNGWELHTEYVGLDMRVPDEILREMPLTLYTHTVCHGDGEPDMDVPTRYSPTLDDALADHKVLADELLDEQV